MRQELDEARETLRAIRSGAFDALVIDAGGGDELFALSGAERRHRLVEVMAEGALASSGRWRSTFDGTLADGPVAPDTLTALAEARARGIRVILVTGRIMNELRAVFAHVEDHVDAVVAETARCWLTSAASAGWPRLSIVP